MNSRESQLPILGYLTPNRKHTNTSKHTTHTYFTRLQIMLATTAAVFATIFAVMATPALAAIYPNLVHTTSGFVMGSTSGNTRTWHIPYGQALRFGRSTPVPAWSDIRDATNPLASCPQLPSNAILPEMSYTLLNRSEDCLSVKVNAPASGLPNRKFPVIVYIHGDVQTSGSTDLDDTSGLTNTGDVIVMSFNYRLFALAMPILPGLESEMENNWFADQVLLLNWVQANAASFGGDPNRVTLMGQFTGAVNAMMHIRDGSTSPQPRAIISSTMSDFAYMHVNETIARTLAWAAESPRNCNQSSSVDILACLRALPLADVLFAPPSLSAPRFRATYGPNTAFDSRPFDYFRQGRFNKNVDVMAGYTSGTGIDYALALTWYLSNFQSVTPLANIGQAQFEGFMAFYWIERIGLPPAALPVLNHAYSTLAAQPGMNYGKALGASIGEGLYFCPTHELLNIADSNNVKTYAYVWKHSPDIPRGNYPDLQGNPGYGVTPSFVFANTGQGYFQHVLDFSSREINQFIPTIQNYWINVAQNGNPRDNWLTFNANDSSGNHGFNEITFNTTQGTVMAPAPGYDGRCAIWANYR